MLEQIVAAALSILKVVILSAVVIFILGAPPLFGSFYTLLLFYPSCELPSIDSIDGVPCRKIKLKSAGGSVLGAWYFEKIGARRIVMVSHGNAGNLSDRAVIAQLFLRMDYSVFLYDYQGYGESSGSPSPAGVLQDGMAVFNYIENSLAYRPDQIVLYGESLGCAVSTHIACERHPAGVILQSGFTSLPDVAKVHFYPFKVWPNWFFYKPHMSNDENVKNIASPMLVLHGVQDEVVPYIHGQQVWQSAKRAGRVVEFVPLLHSGHNNILSADLELYLESIHRFLSGLPTVLSSESHKTLK